MSYAVEVNDFETVDRNYDAGVSKKIQDSVVRARKHIVEMRTGATELRKSSARAYSQTSNYIETLVSSGTSFDWSVDVDKFTKAFDDIEITVHRVPNFTVDRKVSYSSSKKLSLADWLVFIKNDLTDLDSNIELADRINDLSKEKDDLEVGSINSDSLSTFVMFLSSNKINKKPAVGLTRKGYIDASWRSSDNSLIEIVFKPGDESSMVTFSHDRIKKNIINRRVATLPIKNMIDIIKSRKLSKLLYVKSSVSIR